MSLLALKDIPAWGTMFEGRVQTAPAAPAAAAVVRKQAMAAVTDDAEVTRAAVLQLAALMAHGHGREHGCPNERG